MVVNIYTDGCCKSNGKENSIGGYGIYFGENIGAQNGFLVFPIRTTIPSTNISSVLKAREYFPANSMEGEPFAHFNGAYWSFQVNINPTEAPFIKDRFGNTTEVGFGIDSFYQYLEGVIPPGPRRDDGQYAVNMGTLSVTTTDTSLDKGDFYTPPKLKNGDNDTEVVNGCIDPKTQKTFRFRFSGANSLKTSVSSSPNSNIPLPFGGFPGSRKFS